ncbi:IS66 family insertion sequence element accessory protein TnpA [Desulfovibrio gilichinskyi]|uniref:Transposase n=1 Tax=Desulfovibrio gilichinskyi TaxID=1519643 RepID=A0A1X7EXA8_9BACT|nr:hypothetical protein [Desulfovibrio gilichinskyi]SMF42016.1 hypothetical protein SAMN06295933_3456 [Desulfovibrio gilichinskyi]
MTSKQCLWKEHIAAWENSGLSQAEYCRKHCLSYKGFGYNKRKISVAAEPQKVIPVPHIVSRLEEPKQNCKPRKLCVSGIFSLEIEPDFCQRTLKRLLEVIAF